MRKLKTLLLVIAAAALQSCVVADVDQLGACGGSHRLQVTDLDVSPDPLAEGQRISRWFVRLRADGSGECRTTIRVRDESGDLVAGERVWRLGPGVNEIELTPLERYRFHATSTASKSQPILGTLVRWRARRFCARQIAESAGACGRGKGAACRPSLFLAFIALPRRLHRAAIR
jgi:hypothetical protein